jgi:hypothetical protein
MDLPVFEKGLTQWLIDNTGRPIGLADLPELYPNIPYGVLTPINSPRGEGSWADPEEMQDYVFQVLSAGKTPEQTRWMASKVRTALVARALNGYATPMVLAGAEVLWRMSDGLGGIVKTDKLFQIVDTYRVKVA